MPSCRSEAHVPSLVFSKRFADDLAAVMSKRGERYILTRIDSIELFGGYGSPLVPESLKLRFGDNIRKVATEPVRTYLHVRR